MKRRVLLVGDYPPPYGGLSVQLVALQQRLAARGDTDVRVLDIGARRRERRAGCLPVSGPWSFVAQVMRHARTGFTVHLHTNGHNVKSWLAAFVCAASTRRSVLSLGSGKIPAFLDGTSQAVRALARTACRRAGALIVRNEATRRALVRHGAPASTITILPGFYGVSETDLGPVPAPVARFRRGHRPLIGMIASPGPVYGLELMIDAAARLRPRHPELGLLLIGPDRLEEGAPAWIVSAGELERPAMLATMSTLDVFVRPTYYDGDASSLREALALGIRSVATATDFRPEGVRLVPAGDADALADAVARSLAEPPLKVDSTSLPALLRLYDGLSGLDRAGMADTFEIGERAA